MPTEMLFPLTLGWNVENKNYMVTNEGRIITKITNDTSTIFSSHSQFDVNHVIEFKV